MSRVFGLFGGAKIQHSGSSTSLSDLDPVAALQQTLDGLNALLNDDLNGAEKILTSGSSPFHKTGHAAVSFLRALIGFEAEMMKEATERIADAEASAERQRKISVRDNRYHGIYDPGSEYTLCIALSLLMSAVVSFVSESVVDSLKGAYKLRKSYQLLHKMFDMISLKDSYRSPSQENEKEVDDEESGSDEFVDAPDTPAALASPTELASQVESMKLSNGKTHSEPISRSLSPIERRTSGLDRRASIATISTYHEIPAPPVNLTLTDETIYAGTLMALGTIMLLISLLPPSLSRILSIIGFRGSRTQALSMLWTVSPQEGPFGGLATFVLGTYYGNIVQNSDIVSDEFTIRKEDDGGTTLERLFVTIEQVQKRYPRSALWAVEEARMESIKGNLEDVVLKLTTLKIHSQMPQIESLVVFESSLHHLMTHRYEGAAEWFLRMVKTNNWSHGLYTYVAGICYAELHRRNPSHPKYASLANHHLELVPTLLNKRKGFGGRRIPFEAFVERKIARFKLLAGDKDIVEGVTGPVTEEITYLLCNGQKRMGEKELEKSWESLELWKDVECGEEEELAMALIRSVVDRNAGRLDVARERIETKVIAEGLNKKIALGTNDWVAGFAYYELAVISWLQKRPTDEVRGWLKKAGDVAEFPLSNRLSIRIQVAQETLKRR